MRAQPIRRGLELPWFGVRVPAVLVVVFLCAAAPALAAGGFSPAAFKFVPIVQDDREDEGAGWQVAVAQLKFVDTRHFIPRIWSCQMTVGMPLRSTALGRISPELAAEVTASIATEASTKVMHLKETWLTAEFCVGFTAEMNQLFLKKHPKLGARVTSP